MNQTDSHKIFMPSFFNLLLGKVLDHLMGTPRWGSIGRDHFGPLILLYVVEEQVVVHEHLWKKQHVFSKI